MTSARQLARASVTDAILQSARIRLTEDGPAQLSLRAVARDVGMVSSAVYRYFPSRDDLLTALLVAGYDELGEAVEAADAACTSDDAGARWVAACRAIRAWAVAHPGDFALLYGSPVPGYAAPQDTIEPAARVISVLVRAVLDATSDGGWSGMSASVHRAAARDGDADSTSVEAAVADADADADAVAGAQRWLRDRFAADGVPVDLVVRTLMAWTTVFGTISFELFGHFVGSVDDSAAYFDAVVTRLAADLGFDTLRP